jgi:flagellar biogenesis protein FliO
MFKARGQRLHVLESLSLGTRQRLVLVKLDQQELLLGVGANEVHTLLVQPASAVPPVDEAASAAPMVAANPLELIQRWRKR